MVSALKEGREGEELGQSRSQGHSSLPPLDGREAEKRDSGNEVLHMSHKVSTYGADFLAVLFGGNNPRMKNYTVIHHHRLMVSRCS